MYRDFTEQAKNQLKGYIDDVTPHGFFETLGDRISDFFRNFVETDITNYAGNFQGYQKRILDVKNVGKRNIDNLFDKEWSIEDSYKNWLSGACDTYDDELIKSFRALSNMLDAKGAGFHFSRQNLDDFKNASEAVSESSAQIATAKEEIETKEKEIEKLKKEKKGKRGEYNLFSADPVNLATGNFIYEKTDIRPEGEMALSFRRFYNAQDKTMGVLGQGYRHNHEIALQEEKNEVEVIMDDGGVRFFVMTEEGYKGVLATRDLLEKDNEGDETQYVMTTPEGEKYRFNALGKLLEREDSNERKLRYTYNEADQLVRAESDRGDFLIFAYHSNGHLASVTDKSDRMVRYVYENEHLAEVIMANGNRYYYRYTQSGEMQEIKNAREVITVKNTYDEWHRIIRQDFPDGSKMLYEYQGNELILTERNGSKITYTHDEKLRNTDVKYEDGTWEHYEYNEKSQKTLVRDRNGNTTRYSYDAKGNVVKVINALGQISTMTYDANNNLLTVKINRVEMVKNVYDKRGNMISSTEAGGDQKSYQYDDMGRLIHIENADHEQTEIFYTENGQVEKTIDNGVVTTYQYDDRGNVIQVTDAYGNATKYAYDINDQIIHIENAIGEEAYLEYDFLGNVTKITDFDGHSIETQYNELNKESKIIDKEGNAITYEYDSMWNIARVYYPNETSIQYQYNSDNHLESVMGSACDTQKYQYDVNGNLISEENGNGEKTRYVYDSLDRIKKVIDARGYTTGYAYDAYGNIIEKIDAKGNKWNWAYDKEGRCISETDPKGNSTHYEYTRGGRLEKKVLPNGAWETYKYEGGRIKEHQKSVGDVIQYTYDRNGKLTSQENCLGEKIEFIYDVLGRLGSIILPSGNQRKFTYNSVNRVTEIQDENGNVTQYTYSPNGNMTSVTDAMGNRTDYKYDCMGNLIEITQHGEQAEIQVTKYIWNEKSQITQIINPLGDGETYAYDLAGNLVSKIDGDGYVTQMAYDAVGNIEKITYADNTAVGFLYDELNLVKEIQDWNGITSIVNDELGHPTKITDAEGKSLAYEWSSTGERSKVVYPDGSEISYQYDANGLLSHLETKDGIISYYYDKLGRLVQKDLPNGNSEELNYTVNGQISRMQSKGKDHFEEYQYRYDAVGNKIWAQKQRGLGQTMPEVQEYAYDRINQLVKVVENDVVRREYQYDSFGNRTALREHMDQGQDWQVRYLYNVANQLIQKTEDGNQYTYKYDKRGNLSKVSEGKQEIRNFIFDEKNLLSKVQDFNENHYDEIEYQYNGLGYRTQATTKRHNEEIMADTFTIDMTKQYKNTVGMVRTKENSKAETTNFVYDYNIVQFNKDNVINYYFNDELGSVMSLTDASGNDQISYRYDEFGNIDRTDSTNFDYQPFGYTGYQFDPCEGLYYAQARRYDAQNGRFISQDKVPGSQEIVLALHRYIYCANRVFYYVDPDGLMWHVLAGALVGGIVDGGMEVISQIVDGEFNPLDLHSLAKVGVAFGGGFVKGGLTAAGVPPILANTLVNAATTYGKDLIDGKSNEEIGVDVAASVVTDTVMAAGGAVVKKAGKAIKNTNAAKKLTKMVTKSGPYKAIDNVLKNNPITKAAKKSDCYYRMVITKGQKYKTRAHAATIENGIIAGYYKGITGKIKKIILPQDRLKDDVKSLVKHNSKLGVETLMGCVA